MRSLFTCVSYWDFFLLSSFTSFHPVSVFLSAVFVLFRLFLCTCRYQRNVCDGRFSCCCLRMHDSRTLPLFLSIAVLVQLLSECCVLLLFLFYYPSMHAYIYILYIYIDREMDRYRQNVNTQNRQRNSREGLYFFV